jgi:drug/metabolite transporter (DMT)-like permease
MQKTSKNLDHQTAKPLRYENISFEEDICIHILTVSATLLGVCLTVIGIIHIVISANHVQTQVDDILTVDSMFFLMACFLSYWALRSRTIKRMHRVEQIADIAFILGLCLLAAACIMITYYLV